jgi:hypothetical protein
MPSCVTPSPRDLLRHSAVYRWVKCVRGQSGPLTATDALYNELMQQSRGFVLCHGAC